MSRFVPAILVLCSCTSGGPIDARDLDRDGFAGRDDCDDGDPFAYPGASEFCDGIDNDCDGEVDEADALGQPTWYRDDDGDGFGPTGAESIVTCDPGPGWGDASRDCDDSSADVYPGAPESCDGRDEDCNGLIDDDPDVPRYADTDGDGWGDEAEPVVSCDTPGSARRAGDCDDDNAGVHPNADEVCNGIDDDCDELVDDDDEAVDPLTWYPDPDGDGYSDDAAISVVQCDPPNPYWALEIGDCDNGDPASHPGAVQGCLPVDQDCDGSLPDDTAWWDPAWSIRVPLTLTGGLVDADRPWASVDIDLRAALDAVGVADPLDPEGIAVVVQDCTGGARRLDAQFTDGLARLSAGGDPTDPLGDESGAVHFVYDQVLAAGETVGLALYLGGPAAPAPADPVVVGTDSLENSSTLATFDSSRGGLLDDLVPAGGPVVLSQADAFSGNGLATATEWLSAARSPGSVTVVADGPVVGAMQTSVEVSNADAAHSWQGTWWLVTDRPELHATVVWSTTAASSWVDSTDAALALRPLQVTTPGLVDPSTTLDPGARWLDRSDGLWGAAFGWVVPPQYLVEASTGPDGSWTAANDVEAGGAGPVSGAAAGVDLVSGRRLVLLPYAGTLADQGGALDALMAPPLAQVTGPAESL